MGALAGVDSGRGVCLAICTTEVWARLTLSSEDCARVRSFFRSEFGVTARHMVRNMHLTVYHARRPMPGVETRAESSCVVVPATDFRFMVMSPGGENPRPDLVPSELCMECDCTGKAKRSLWSLGIAADC